MGGTYLLKGIRKKGTHPILNDLQAKVNIMKQIEAEIQQELNAILPSILDKAFKGELLYVETLTFSQSAFRKNF